MQPLDDTAPMHAAGATLAAGQTLGRYVVRKLLGVGGMGVVYEAFDPQLERKVALKLLRAKPAGEARDEERGRALREAQAMARIRHVNVITIYDVGTIGEEVFLAMELIEGSTVGAWLRKGRRSVAEILRVFAAAGCGLAAAHEVGVVHRDFKPDNVLIGNDGHVQVTDFGLASSTTKSDGASGRVEIAGTPGYMAPEQRRGLTVDARADQFSFCVALYEALYGVRPAPGATPEELPKRRRAPARVQAALRRGLSLEPDARFATMAPLLEAIAPAHRAWPTLAAATVAVLLAGGALAWSSAAKQNRVILCKRAATKMTDLWSASRQAEVARTLGQAQAAGAWPLVKARLERYVETWSGLHGLTCEASRAADAPAVSRFDLRMECLDQRWRELHALVDLLAAQPGAAEHALDAIAGLAPVEACLDVEGPRRAARPTAPPEKLRPAEEGIARGKAELLVGQCKQALVEAQNSAALANAAGALVLETRARQLVGDVQKCLGQPEVAHSTFLEAAGLAARANYDEGVADVFLQLQENAVEREAFDEAMHWSQLAGEAIAPLANPRLRARLSTENCNLALERSQFAEAERHCREARTRFAALPERSRDEADAIHTLGNVLSREARFAEAAEQFREAQRLFAQLLGPESFDESRVLWSLAAAEGEQDHAETQLALFKRVMKHMEPDSPDSVTLTLSSYGAALNDAGRSAEALPYLQQALAAAVKIEPHTAQEAVARLELGRAYLALGKTQQSVGEFERAWRLYPVAGNEPDRALVGIDFARAIYEATPDHARAIAVARESRAYMTTHPLGPYRARRLRELEAWLAAHDPAGRDGGAR